jgi:hypothetical protein
VFKIRFVRTDLDTLLAALYVFCDDRVVPPERRRPGRPKKLSDAELICLAVAQVLLGFPSQHHWLRFAYGRLGHLFPYLPKQPGYHKRLVTAAPLIMHATRLLAAQVPSHADQLRLIDATPLPCGTSRETVKRSQLAGWANYGYCASHSRFYWGVKLYLVTTLDGMPIVWCLADPKLGEREVAAELLGHWSHPRPGRPACRCRAHRRQGLRRAGVRTPDERTGDHLRPARPTQRGPPSRQPRRDPPAHRIDHQHREVSAVLGTPRRTHPAGVMTRVAQRVLALAAAIWHNWAADAPVKRSLIAYDH